MAISSGLLFQDFELSSFKAFRYIIKLLVWDLSIFDVGIFLLGLLSHRF